MAACADCFTNGRILRTQGEAISIPITGYDDPAGRLQAQTFLIQVRLTRWLSARCLYGQGERPHSPSG